MQLNLNSKQVAIRSDNMQALSITCPETRLTQVFPF